MTIDYEQDRVQSVTQTDTAKSLSDKVIELKNLEDEIENAEESLSKLKEKAKYISNPSFLANNKFLMCLSPLDVTESGNSAVPLNLESVTFLTSTKALKFFL